MRTNYHTFNYCQEEHEQDVFPVELKIVAKVNCFIFKDTLHVEQMSFKMYSDDNLEISLDILSELDFKYIRNRIFYLYPLALN